MLAGQFVGTERAAKIVQYQIVNAQAPIGIGRRKLQIHELIDGIRHLVIIEVPESTDGGFWDSAILGKNGEVEIVLAEIRRE
jgi:hypothetical protein